MALDKTQRDEFVRTNLKLGFSPEKIYTMCETTNGMEGYKMSTIYTLSREYKKLIEAESISDLAILPQEAVQHVVVEAKKKVSNGAMPQEAKLDALAKLQDVLSASESLKKLDVSYHATLTMGLEVATGMLQDPELSIQHWSKIMDTISSSHAEIFSSSTNIHIGDNNNDNKKQTVFQNSMNI